MRFHWSLFPGVQKTIFQHWFRYWLGAGQATSRYLNQWWLVYRHIYASLSLNELRKYPALSHFPWITVPVKVDLSFVHLFTKETRCQPARKIKHQEPGLFLDIKHFFHNLINMVCLIIAQTSKLFLYTPCMDADRYCKYKQREKMTSRINHLRLFDHFVNLIYMFYASCKILPCSHFNTVNS